MSHLDKADEGAHGNAGVTAFVSYARSDIDVALRVVRALEARGVGCTIDTRDLPYGERWQAELEDFIRSADAIVFLVSPRSVESRWCKWELAQVGRGTKRLVPAVVIPTPSGDLPAEIAEIHLVDLSNPQTFDVQVAKLAQALTTDIQWLKEHTRLADRAAKWRASDGAGDHLLRGRALRDATAWRVRRPASAPDLSQEQLAYLLASEAAGRRRQAWAVAGALLVAAGGVALAVWAQSNAREAQLQSDAALRHQSLYLADAARQLYEQNRASTPAALLALEALPDTKEGRARPYVPQAEMQLQTSMQILLGARYLVAHEATVNHFAHSRDGKWMASAAQDHRVCLWADAKGPPVHCLPHDGAVVVAVWLIGEAPMVLSVDALGRLRLWEATTGRLVRVLQTVAGSVQAAALNPAENRLALAGGDGAIHLLDVDGGRVERIDLEPQEVRSLVFSPDGRRLLGAVQNRALVWDVRDGALRLELKGHSNDVNDASFSPDGKWIATGSSDRSVRIWDAHSARQINAVTGRDSVWSVRFSPTGGRLLRATSNAVSVLDSGSLQEISRQAPGAEGMVELRRAYWSPDGTSLVAAEHTGPVRVWQVMTDTQQLVDFAKVTVPSCLTPTDRTRHFLDPEPPLWCIAMQKDNYRGTAWSDWLAQRRRGLTPPIPETTSRP